MENGWIRECLALAASITLSTVVASRSKGYRRKGIDNYNSTRHVQHDQTDSTTEASSSGTNLPSSASNITDGIITTAATAASAVESSLKSLEDKATSHFRKTRLKFLKTKTIVDEKEEKTQFEKVAVRQRPARSKNRSRNALKWKEGVKPPKTAKHSAGKKKKHKKKRHRKQKKPSEDKLETTKNVESVVEEHEKEVKTVEREKTETEPELDLIDDQSGGELGSNEESEEDGIDGKKKDAPKPSSLATYPSEPTGVLEFSYLDTGKGSAEFVTPAIMPDQEPIFWVAAKTAAVTGSSSSIFQSNDTNSTEESETKTSEEDPTYESEPIILSGPACHALNLIMKKDLFKNSANSEAENDLIRQYFAGRVPPERTNAAQETLQRAVELAITRLKSGGVSAELYQFLSNRSVAVSLMIDAMKYRKKDFLPLIWR
ncbi:unnamed protein product [Thelazia callipaeda]|uniref:DUF659 domain-containing protein n=1 Tax=Thelazia callipaeda TaxID=103827 RepID=A0A0N5CLG3_THECL|nr:unnamed protein product [Thelazia callipaeda]